MFSKRANLFIVLYNPKYTQRIGRSFKELKVSREHQGNVSHIAFIYRRTRSRFQAVESSGKRQFHSLYLQFWFSPRKYKEKLQENKKIVNKNKNYIFALQSCLDWILFFSRYAHIQTAQVSWAFYWRFFSHLKHIQYRDDWLIKTIISNYCLSSV